MVVGALTQWQRAIPKRENSKENKKKVSCNILGNISGNDGSSTSSSTQEINLLSKNSTHLSSSGINLTNCTDIIINVYNK